MLRKLISILSMLVVISFVTTSVFAGNVSIRRVSFSLGSLIADGTLVGLGNQDVTVILDATGIPVVTCTNPGGAQAPGQNPPKVSATGTQFLVHNTYTKNGTSPFNVETQQQTDGLTAKHLGCPSNKWTAEIVFVFWTNATIIVRAGSVTGPILLQQNFVCTTTRTPPSVTCTPTP